jgi:hypothetical protein
MAISGSWVFDRATGKMIDKSEALERDYQSIAHAVSDLAAPYVKSDYIKQPFRSAIDGSMQTSKAAWEKQVRASGYEITGGEMTQKTISKSLREKARRKDIQDDVAKAVNMVEQGFKPAPVTRTSDFGDMRDVAKSRASVIHGAPMKDVIRYAAPAKKSTGRKTKRGTH